MIYLHEVQDKVDQWIKLNGVRYFDELTNALILNEEVGEFSSLVARIYGEQSFKTIEQEQAANENIKDELGDIFFVIVCLANQMDISIEEIFKKNLAKKTKRDKHRHHNNPKLNTRNSKSQ